MLTLLLAIPFVAGGDDHLDSAEILSLANSLAPSEGPHLGLLLRTRLAYSSDVDASAAPGQQNLGNFNLDVARLSLSGAFDSRYSYYVSLEAGEAAQQDSPFAGPGVSLLDAWAKVDFNQYLGLKVGQICTKFLMSCCIDERNLLFLDRSFIGESMDNRDRGMEFNGAVDRFEWWASAQNGFDGTGKDMAFGARASYRFFGDSSCTQEGACGMKGDSLTLGVGWFDDESMNDGKVVAGDLYYAHDGWSASAELASFGDDMRPMPGVSGTTGIILPGMGGSTGAHAPYALTLGYAFPDTQYQLAGRFQKLDDMDNTSIASFVVSEIAGSGPCRISIQYDHANSDNAALQVETIAIGLTVGI